MRVKLITQDVYLQPSALWNSSTDPSGQVRPWGLQAMDVASAGSSNGTATVYVLDTGVEMHADLPGLAATDRLSALPGINPTGCYAHATHVAGIIGAADNGSGTVGVLPGVRIVSIALGDTNSDTVPCPQGSTVGFGSHGNPASAFTQGLEKIYQRVLQSNAVGIANMSFNGGGGLFSSTGTIGLKMRAVATPTWEDGVGYKGVFIAQAAGNNFSDACEFAYNQPFAYDGILVVGGLDDNGQRVLPLIGPYVPFSGPYGYKNLPIASDEPGSNTGSCVEVWAPSQRVLSTWSGGSTQLLSGTSMAAPHISGFAARVLESDSYINTSLDLEAAVRAYFTVIAGSNLSMPRLSLQNAIAAPTIEMAEGTTRSSIGPINFNKLAENVDLKYEAVGATYCDVYVTRNGAYYSMQYYLPTSYDLGANLLPSGQYTWSVTCTSPQATQNTVVAIGAVTNISLSWLANTTSTIPNGMVPISHGGTVYWSVPQNASFDQISSSSGADYCQVHSYGFNGNPIGDPEHPARNPFQPYSQVLLWDSGTPFPTYYQFATLYFGNPTPYDGYKWRLTCSSNFGLSKSTVMYGKPQP